MYKPKVPNGRMVDGEPQLWGGECQCRMCTDRQHREGFYRAPRADYEAAEYEAERSDAFWRRHLRGMPPIERREPFDAYQQRVRAWKLRQVPQNGVT